MTTTSKNSKSSRFLPVHGEIYLATKKGFAQFLQHANLLHRKGYELVTLVPVERSLAAVWKRVREADLEYGSFVGEDNEDSIPSYR